MTTELSAVTEWARETMTGTARSRPPSFDRLTRVSDTFSLRAFEEALLALALAVEADGSLADCIPGGRLTVGFALDRLPEPFWDAFAPARPLRRWELIHLEQDAPLTRSVLRVDEGVLLSLLGSDGLDESLIPHFRQIEGECHTNDRIETLAKNLEKLWSDQSPVVNLIGSDPESHRSVAARASSLNGLNLWLLDAAAIPETPDGQFKLATKWTRYAALHGASLYVECLAGTSHMVRLLQHFRTPCAVGTEERLDLRDVAYLEVARPTRDERQAQWESILGSELGSLNGQLRLLVEQFDVPHSSVTQVLTAARQSERSFEDAMWDEAKCASRRSLEGLAQRIEPVATWEDLVLPKLQVRALKELVGQVRKRVVVHEDWGFGDRIARGQGVAALFHGSSGTGKTLSAEVVANELSLDLFRIDLASVVSKYIGDTEKNLKRLFDAAERCGAILLFDEADALFGKRTEVKDSHDRYANIEVSYLLQRMESYRGVAILTTNMKDCFDPAFLRRLRFMIEFPFPGATEREEIWRRSLPKKAPLDDVSVEKLSALSIPGGNIRNISLSAAFLAANEDSPITMRHLLSATRTEFAKFDRPLIESEVAGWS